MNRRICYLALGLCAITALLLASCINAIPLPASEEETTQSPSSSESTPSPTQPELVVIECPTEARIGEYITVCLEVPRGFDPQIYDEYNLYIQNERSIGMNWYDLGYARRDQDRIVCWHAAIPCRGIGNMYTNLEETEWDDITRPGVFKLLIVAPLRLDLGYEEGDGKILLERNIIIKE